MSKLSMQERDEIILSKYVMYYELIANKQLDLMPYKRLRGGRRKISIEDNYWSIIDGIPILFMQCCICRVFKPQLCAYYLINSHGLDFWAWLEKYEVGLELFHNNKQNSCIECKAKTRYHNIRNNVPAFWSNCLRGKNISIKGIKDKFDSQTIGPISGISTQYMIQASGHNLMVSIHDIGMHHKQTGEKYSHHNHILEDCVLDFSLLNVPQRTHITDLRLSTIESYQACCIYYNTQSYIPQNITFDKSLKGILQTKAGNYIYLDKKVNRQNDEIKDKKLYLFNILVQGQCICDTCKVPLTFKENKWTDLSFDRIDNSKGHFVQYNLRTVCMLHQIPNGRYLTHNMFLHMLYIQQHFKIDEYIKAKIQKIHTFHDCPFCDIIPL